VIPLKDTTPRQSFPFITVLLIVVNFVVFFHQISLTPAAGDHFVRLYGLVPSRIELALAGRHYTMAQALVPLFTCMFLHGGWLHIIGNMWFLWIFGGNVEDRMGSMSYLLFYMICGLGSGISEVAFSWGSTIPSIGASGAISGVLGAYIVFFPTSRILSLIPLLVIWFMARVPAWIFIGLWFVVQFLSGLGSLATASSGGVAWWAHVGGFALGALLAKAFASPRRRAASAW
jgi:membrane associated rhomboid family serine protease